MRVVYQENGYQEIRCPQILARGLWEKSGHWDNYKELFDCVVLIFLILMHSGKDAGLSGAFGVGTGAGPFGGGSLVERNLNRWTIGFAIVFAINTIVLIKIT